MPQFNTMKLPEYAGAGVRDANLEQNREFNKLRTEAAQIELDDNAKMKNTLWQTGVGKHLMDLYEQDPRLMMEAMPQVGQEGKRRGIMDSQFDFSSMTPEQVLEGARNMYQSGTTALQGLQQYRDVPNEGGPVTEQRHLPTGQRSRIGTSRGPTANSMDWAELQSIGEEFGMDSPQYKQFAAQLVAPRYQTINEVPHRLTPTDEQPLSTLDDTVAAASELAEEKKFAEMTGSLRSRTIDTSYESVKGVEQNIRNIDRAIDAIDEGASTGAIEARFFPSFREATIKLEQVQKELGLDVIGSVTFGALSKGELDLALATALPTGLEPPALRSFLVSKRAAQEKLRKYYLSQIDFIDQGGTIPGFLRSRQRRSSDAEPATLWTQERIDAFDQTWALLPPGAQIMSPDGKFRTKPEAKTE